MGYNAYITGDSRRRQLLTDFEEKDSIDIYNSNLKKTVEQIGAIEGRLRLAEQSSSLATVSKGEQPGATAIRTRLTQFDVPAGATIYVFDPVTNNRHHYKLKKAAPAGSKSLQLVTPVSHSIAGDTPVYVDYDSTAELASKIESIFDDIRRIESASTTGWYNEINGLRSIVSNVERETTGRITQLETEISQTAQEIKLRASKDIKEIDDRLTSWESRISVTAEEIELVSDRITSLENETKANSAGISITADRLQLFAREYQEFLEGYQDAYTTFSIAADGVTSISAQLEEYSEEIRLQYSEISQVAHKITQQVSWEEFATFEGSQVFTTTGAALAPGGTSLTLSSVPTRLKPGDVLLIRDADATIEPWRRTWFEVTIGGVEDIPASGSAVSGITISAVPAGKKAVSGSNVHLRGSLFTSIKNQTAFEISQAVIASQRVTEISTVKTPTLGGVLAGGSTYTTIPIQSGVLTELNHGDALVIYDEDNNLAWNVVVNLVNGEADNPYVPDTATAPYTAHTIPVQSFDPITDIPDATPIFTATSALQSIIEQLASEITLVVSATNPFYVAKINDTYVSGTPTTTLTVTETNFALKDNDTIVVTATDGTPTLITVNGNHNQGVTTINVDSVALDADIDDPISIGLLTALRIDLDGITIDGPGLYSANWLAGGGIIDTGANFGKITQHSTAGWALSREGELEAHDIYIRSTLRSGGSDGTEWNGQLTEDESGLHYTLGEPTNLGTAGWVLTKAGEFVATKVFLREEVSISTASDSIKLNSEGLKLPMGGADTIGAVGSTSWVEWEHPTAASSFIGAWHDSSGKTTLAVNSGGQSANSEVFIQGGKTIISDDLQVNKNLKIGDTSIISPASSGADIQIQTTGGNGTIGAANSGNIVLAPGGDGRILLEGVRWPNGTSPAADYFLRSTSATELEWREAKLERPYDFVINRPGTLRDNESIASGAPRDYRQTAITVSANWGSPSATIVVNGHSFNSGSTSWGPGDEDPGGLSVAVSGTANGASDVVVTIKGYWTPA